MSDHPPELNFWTRNRRGSGALVRTAQQETARCVCPSLALSYVRDSATTTSVMEPLRRLSDRGPLTVASQSLFLGRRPCPSISSSPSASFSRSREVPLESEALSPYARSKDALATSNIRELAMLPAAACGVRP